MKTQNEEYTCHNCGVREGHFHKINCCCEKCPFCGGQLLSCDCIYKLLNLYDRQKYTSETSFLPPDIYYNGVTDEHSNRFDMLLKKQGLYPYIDYPLVCAKCGELSPSLFMVPKEEWRKYIEPDMQSKILCQACYDYIKRVTDQNRDTA